MSELWKFIEGFEDYEISNFGNIKGKRGLRKICTDRDGYGICILRKDGKSYPKKVHRLVAQTFLDKPEGKDFVNHKDTNKLNNHYSNLEWCTRQENQKHAVDLGLFKGRNVAKKEEHGRAKITEDIVKEIIKEYTTTKTTQYKLAAKYNLSQRHIGRIVNKESWK